MASKQTVPAGHGQLTYSPPPNEMAYYEALFATADHSGSGQLGGLEAVNFFARSRLPMDFLRNIWTMSDKPQTNTLDKPKFFVAVRLIQLFQNGQKAENSNLDSTSTMRPPYFEGVTCVSIQPFEAVPPTTTPATTTPTPTSPQPQPQPEPPKEQPLASPLSPGRPPMYPTSSAAIPLPQVTTTLAVQDPYTMLPSEQSRYEALFPQYEVQKDGFVYGKEAVDLFSKSGLDNETLRNIWNMVDDPIDNKLSKLEFAMAMHLIVCVSKKNLPLPPSLPLSLKSLKNNDKNNHSSDSVSTMTAPPQTTQPQQNTMPPQPLVVPTEPQQLISPSMSYDTAGNQPHETPNPNSSDKSVVGNNSVMSAPPSGNLSISDAFDDLNPVTAAAAGSSYLTNPTPDTLPTNSQPPPLMNQNSAPPTMATMNSIPPPSLEPQPQTNVDMSTAALGMGVGMGIGAAMTMNQPTMENNVMENQPTLSMAPMTDLTSSVPAPAPATQKATTLGTDDEELTKMEAVLQKLRAENISLRAQMGQYTEEELEVRKQISVTISEIGVVSQEVAALRVKVSDANSALIEATIEMKAKTEEKQQVQDLLNELTNTNATLETSLENVKEASEALDKRKGADAPPPTFDSSLFGFDAPASDLAPATNTQESQLNVPEPVVNEYAPASTTQNYSDQGHVEGVNTFVPPDSTDGSLMGGTIGSLSQHHPSADTLGAVDQNGKTSLDDHSIPGVQQSRTSEEVEDLKLKARKAESAARSAEDHARALAIQLEEMKLAVADAERIAEEKQGALQGKKKGFGRNKKAVKEADVAKKEAEQVKRNYEDTKSEMSVAQTEILSLNKKADSLREDAEHAEIEFAQQESINSQITMQSNIQSKTTINVPNPATNYNYGYGNTSAPAGNTNGYGYGNMGTDSAAPMGGTKAPFMNNVMNNTASDGIPEPTNNANDYANPFGGF